MDEKKLIGFVGIYEMKSITKAAEKLYMTAPALMRQLDALENELGAVLFSRSPSGYQPTQAGRLLYARIVPVLRELNAIREQLKMLSHEENRLRVCTTVTSLLPLIHLYCEALLETFPSAEIEYIPRPRGEWIRAVQSGEADCALLPDVYCAEHIASNLAYAEIGSRQIIAIMAPKHPLASSRQLTKEALVGEEICMDRGAYHAVSVSLAETAVRVHVLRKELTSSEIFNFCSKKGIYVTTSPYGAQFNALVSIPIDLPSMRCGWVTRKKRSHILKELIRVSRAQNEHIR